MASVSVIINVSHDPDALHMCLDSVLSQDYPDMEIIVVDGSGKGDKAQALKAAYPSIFLLPQSPDTGFAKGKNSGVRMAHGQICVFLSDSCAFTQNDAVSKAVAYFSDATLGCLSMRVVDSYDRVVAKFIPRRDRKIITQDEQGANFIAAACAIRRSAFDDAGGLWEALDPHFGGEPELSYRLLDKGWRILHTPHITARCRDLRQPRKVSRRLYCGTRNTPWIAMRNLPWHAVVSLTFFTWGYFFLVAARDRQLLIFYKGMFDSILSWPKVFRMRKPIGAQALAALRDHSGLRYY